MNALLERLRAYLDSRSPRERWLLVLGLAVVLFFVVQSTVIARLNDGAIAAEVEAEKLEADRMRAVRLAADVRAIQGGVETVQTRIKPGEKTNLLALLERLATESKISKEQLESIKPKQAGKNAQYPETGVEVQLRGVSLEQTTGFLRKIETSESHLIIRSLGIRSRPTKQGSNALDAKFSVSSFERA